MPTNLNIESKPKSFWKRPEGVLGAIFLIGIVVILVLYYVVIIAFITSLLQSLVTTIALFVVVGIFLFMLVDKTFRNLIWYMYKSIMRKITGLFVQINPIRILESYIEYLKKNLRQMNIHISKLRGQIAKLKSIVERNKREMEQNLKLAEKAKKENKRELVVVHTRQYGRINESNKKYNSLLIRLELLFKILKKIHSNSKYLIQDTDNEVRMRKQEMRAIRAGHSAMKRAMSIIQGDPDKKNMFDIATEAIAEDVYNKIGEMERFIQISGNFIDSVDLQNVVYEQEGLEILEKMDKEGMSFLLGDHTNNIDDIENSQIKEIEIENYNDYTSLFE